MRVKFSLKFISLVMFIPVIHVLANITTNYYSPETINPGFFRVLYFVLVLTLFFIAYNPRFKSLFIVVLIYLTYNFILVLLNQELMESLINFTRLSIPILLLFVGYSVIHNYEDYLKLLKFFLIGLFLFILNYIVSNIFDLGLSVYLDDSFYIGGAGGGAANEIAVFIVIALSFLLLSKEKRWNIFAIILIASATIIILLSMRRGAFLTLGIALVLYTYIIGINWKIAKYSVLGASILLITLPLYSDIFIERYEYRTLSRDGSLANLGAETRFLELEWVPATLSQEGAWMFGTHNLNSVSYFGGRELHIGYMAILHGSGIIGISLFFLIIILLYRKGRFVFKKSNKYIFENRVLYALYLSLIASLLAYLLTSRLHGFSVTTPVFLMLGAILGCLNSKKFNNKIN